MPILARISPDRSPAANVAFTSLRSIGLEEINEGFDALATGNAIRQLILFEN